MRVAESKVGVEQVRAALGKVLDPELRRDLVSLGMIQKLAVEGGTVSFDLVLTTPACPLRNEIRQAAETAARAVPGVTEVKVNVTSKVASKAPAPQALLPGVKNVIAVASGKGGVGKSTVAANLALALAEAGARVGVLDADIYGPSLPTLMGAAGEMPSQVNNRLIPVERFGVKLMSLGFLIEGNTPVIWRGPMVAGAVRQLLTDVAWGELDYLVVDLPPGTGDAQLTLAQSVPLTGVVIVMTSQDMALNIAGKALLMFRKMDVPVLGVVENMSSFVCPHCERETAIFGARGGGERAAAEMDVPFLGAVPLEPAIVEESDQGTPSIAAHPESRQAEAFRKIAGAVAGQVSVVNLK